MIKFNFKAASFPTQEEFKKAIPTGGKIFAPGQYDLVIDSVTADGESRDDKTWAQFKVVLAGEGKTIQSWIDVPTSKLDYTHPEGSRANPFSKFLNLQSFFRALGTDLEPTAESVGEKIPAIFGDEDTLVGQAITVEIGFYAHHIARLESGEYFVSDRNGKPIDEETYEQRDVALLEAASLGLYIQKFPRILKFISKEG